MAIEHRRLGKHGVLVSNICLGTMNFGWHTSQEESFKIMDRALELGINFFDTADVYGWGGEQATPRRSWDAGLPRVAAAGTRWFWPPKCSIPSSARPTCQNPTQTAAAFRRTRSASTAKAASNGSRPTTSIFTRCTTWTGIAPGTRLGKPSNNWGIRARWFMWGPATSRHGTLPLPARRLPNAV